MRARRCGRAQDHDVLQQQSDAVATAPLLQPSLLLVVPLRLLLLLCSSQYDDLVKGSGVAQGRREGRSRHDELAPFARAESPKRTQRYEERCGFWRLGADERYASCGSAPPAWLYSLW